jgi:hypothetical protein
MTAKETREERRRDPRRLTLRTGRLFGSGEGADVDGVICAVLDESAHGACLLVPEHASVPDVFVLVLDGRSEQMAGSVKWRNGSRIGVLIAALAAE